jgi:hypothetical protein
LSEYEDTFIQNGYDNINFIIKHGLLKSDLIDIGIKLGHIKRILFNIDEYRNFYSK